MRIASVIIFMAISCHCFGQASIVKSKPATVPVNSSVPDEVITPDSLYWTISTISTIGYVNTTPGPSYNQYQSGGGMLVKFRFLKNNRFNFHLYVQANTYGTLTESWTQVEGAVEFTKDNKGQPVFITHAEKGTYRTNKNGVTNTRPIPTDELKGQHSSTYLWQQTNLADDALNTYLLMVDLEAHPGADVNQPSSIDPTWVSKFHIPRRK